MTPYVHPIWRNVDDTCDIKKNPLMYQIKNLRFSYKLSHNQECIEIIIIWVILFYF